ncbi:MAG TPA: hypothetical protein VIU37_09110, partial [Candidatus Limnocylindrales bacterium]
MTEVRRVPSSIFRLTYVRETEPVAVTVQGRVIGHYVPGHELEYLTVGQGDNTEVVAVVRRE